MRQPSGSLVCWLAYETSFADGERAGEPTHVGEIKPKSRRGHRRRIDDRAGVDERGGRSNQVSSRIANLPDDRRVNRLSEATSSTN